LTNDEELEAFLSKYRGDNLPIDHWRKILSAFDNQALRDWAAKLGIETFAAPSGKVFPVAIGGTIKAAPLLRRWITRLRSLGVNFRTRHQWLGLENDLQLIFDHDNQTVRYRHDRIILALGGASWPQTGSTGAWTHILAEKDITITSLTAANCGWEVDWPAPLRKESEGLPLKNLNVMAGNVSRRGELVVTRYGLEGGPIYRLGPTLRGMPSPEITIDFKPDQSLDQLIERMGAVKRNFVREARRRWKLDPATGALLKHLPDRGPWRSVEQLAREVKACRVRLTHPRPVEEAISSAGGISWSELDENLMLKKLPGIYAAGEMLDWEAPTGGYLLQACFATGTWVGRTATAPG